MPVRWRSRSSMAAMDWRPLWLEGAQFVELGVDAGGDGSAVGQGQGWLGDE